MIVDMISSLGRSVIKFFRALGRSGFMLFGALVGKPQIRQHFPLLVKQLYALGVQSLLIILLSGLFIGMVLGLQGYVVLVDFSAETSLGQLVALSLLRELGPVVTALLFAGRAGSALVDAGSFWSVMQNAVSWSYDILNGFIKSVFFAIAVVWIALFNGYDCIPTSEGISQATTRTVVHASLVVLGLDFILTAIMFGAG